MELRHLRYFIAVAEELHFGRAAQRLQIAQPPLSQQIRQLEAELQTQLLWRNKRHVELTDAGRAFLEEARKTLGQAERAARTARLAHDEQTGSLLMGFVDSALYDLLPRLVRAYRQLRPDIHVHLREMSSGQQVRALVRRELQVGLLRPARVGREIVFEELCRERLLVALPHGHRLSAEPEIAPAQLRGEPFVFFERALAPALHDFLLGLFRRARFTPTIAHEAGDGHTIVALVGAGVGVSLVAESMRHWGGSQVVYRPLRHRSAWLPMCMAWHRDARSEVVESFVACARAATGAGGTSHPPGGHVLQAESTPKVIRPR